MLYHVINLRARVRQDFQQESETGFLNNVEIDNLLNEAYYKYVSRLILASQGYFETQKYLDLTANVETVALPYNFLSEQSILKTVRIERVTGSIRIPLNYRKRYNESNPTQAAAQGQSYLPTYDFRGQNLVLEPMPTSSETGSSSAGLSIVYAGLPPRLQCGNVTDADEDVPSITLDSTADPRDDYYNGAKVFIVSGAGAGQIRTVNDYVGSTREATVDSSWDTLPDTTSVFSTLIHDDFPEIFHELLPLYATKMAFAKERSFGSQRAYDANALKEKEKELVDFCANKTIARQFVQPWHPEI